MYKDLQKLSLYLKKNNLHKESSFIESIIKESYERRATSECPSIVNLTIYYTFQYRPMSEEYPNVLKKYKLIEVDKENKYMFDQESFNSLTEVNNFLSMKKEDRDLIEDHVISSFDEDKLYENKMCIEEGMSKAEIDIEVRMSMADGYTDKSFYYDKENNKINKIK